MCMELYTYMYTYRSQYAMYVMKLNPRMVLKSRKKIGWADILTSLTQTILYTQCHCGIHVSIHVCCMYMSSVYVCVGMGHLVAWESVSVLCTGILVIDPKFDSGHKSAFLLSLSSCVCWV